MKMGKKTRFLLKQEFGVSSEQYYFFLIAISASLFELDIDKALKEALYALEIVSKLLGEASSITL